MYYAQRKLDEYIHKNFIKHPFSNGTFLELGAIDGVKFSNTKFFEDNMGFSKGVLIEPDPVSFKSLVKNRPNCYCFNYAIHNTLAEVTFLQSEENAVGCIDTVAPDGFKERWHKKSTRLTVPAYKLSSVLAKTDIEYIDFWSLDVEGSELECLKSMNWSIPVGLLAVETSYNKKEIISLLEDYNFTFLCRLVGSNEIFFNFNYFRKNYFYI